MKMAKRLVTLLLVAELIGHSLAGQSVESKGKSAEDVAETVISSESAPTGQISEAYSQSYRIQASGWPQTSPMWPTTNSSEQSASENSTQPFIYAERPRTIDYSLLLRLNQTLVDSITSRQLNTSRISFEYYFNYEPDSITAPPGIRLELDRKQYTYLEPQEKVGIRTKIWQKFSDSIELRDLSQLNKHDWLKISLVNRQWPSLVAIRRLRVEFLRSGLTPESTTPTQPPRVTPDPSAPVQSPPSKPAQDSPVPIVAPTNQTAVTPATPLAIPPIYEEPPSADGLPSQPASPTEYEPPSATSPVAPGGFNIPQGAGGQTSPDASPDLLPSATTRALSSTIKPVNPKRSGWSILGRKRREAASETNENLHRINLLCTSASTCDHWHADGRDDQIQWSLGRMPPLTSAVQNGYFYVSNRNNYGDMRQMLYLSLNETENARLADQNSDHCLELAVYVTEGSQLSLYKTMRNSSNPDLGWAERSEPLLTWSPTTLPSSSDDSQPARYDRPALPGAQLQSDSQITEGWTKERICFGNFFIDHKQCGVGRCAFAFEMTEVPFGSRSTAREMFNEIEQVAAIALLRNYSININDRDDQDLKKGWLETWQREEIEPNSNWTFYPQMDLSVNSDNITLRNLHDRARYFLQSDWLKLDDHLDFNANLTIEFRLMNKSREQALSYSQSNSTVTSVGSQTNVDPSRQGVGKLFSVHLTKRIVDSQYNTILTLNSSIDWALRPPADLILASNTSGSVAPVFHQVDWFDLGSQNLSEQIKWAQHLPEGTSFRDSKSWYKIILELILDVDRPANKERSVADVINRQFTEANNLTISDELDMRFQVNLANVSLSDRCYLLPCGQYGTCKQNGTAPDDWECRCDSRHRGRRCEFGQWCKVAHVVWNPSMQTTSDNTKKIQTNQHQLQQSSNTISSSVIKINGDDFCQRKFGLGSKCAELDVALNEQTYFEDDRTFTCSCRDDYYLSDDSKCKQSHQCNSIVCLHYGQQCDESKPFNRTQACQCNERLDFEQVQPPPPLEPGLGVNQQSLCMRRQCHDPMRDCGFDAHLCIPTVPGERPLCKCADKFALQINSTSGKRSCESKACVLPTLNDCEQLCEPDNSNIQRPYKCACHPGYQLDSKDGRTCRAVQARHMSDRANCRPACDNTTQICTELGCKCRQGYLADSEVVERRTMHLPGSNNVTQIDYVKSAKCLNVCSLTYGENKQEFERIESVCPFGLCDPETFQCRCSDPNSSALLHTKYEPMYASLPMNQSDEPITPMTSTESSLTGITLSYASSTGSPLQGEQSVETLDLSKEVRRRSSAQCQLKRVCQTNSASYKLCQARGAICIPDYSKPAMFDCICPEWTQKRQLGSTIDQFLCEPKCQSIKQECIRKQAQCKLIDRNQVRCDCAPGFMFHSREHKCLLAKHSYAIQLVLVNRYYEPEWRFYKYSQMQRLPSNETMDSSHGLGFNENKINDIGQNAINQFVHEILPQYDRLEPQVDNADTHVAHRQPLMRTFIGDYNQCNLSTILSKSILDDQYEHNFQDFLQIYLKQCNERLREQVRTYKLNSRLADDIRQSLQQHIRYEFTVTTNNSQCNELSRNELLHLLPSASQSKSYNEGYLRDFYPGLYLNCTIYIQANQPVGRQTIDYALRNCDRNGADQKYCWIKPRLLLLRSLVEQTNMVHQDLQQEPMTSMNTSEQIALFKFKQIIPCEFDGFCTNEAQSYRLDDQTSLCSCKCPPDVEIIDVKELEPRPLIDDQPRNSVSLMMAIKEICAPKNYCLLNSTYCSTKPGSVCSYDIRVGTRCQCVHPSYEDAGHNRCVEVAFSPLDNMLIIIIIILGTSLVVSILLNLYALAKSTHYGKSLLAGHSKQYPMNEFSSSAREQFEARANNGNMNRNQRVGDHRRGNSRSTGMPNYAFDNDDE